VSISLSFCLLQCFCILHCSRCLAFRPPPLIGIESETLCYFFLLSLFVSVHIDVINVEMKIKKVKKRKKRGEKKRL